MGNLFAMMKSLVRVKMAKVPDSSLEQRIDEEKTKLSQNVSLIRLAQSEINQTRVNRRWEVIDELLTDVARRQ